MVYTMKNMEVSLMIAWGRMVRSLTFGLAIAVVAIGLLPFLVVFLMSDLSGLIELDPTPFFAFASKFIRWGK